MMKKIILAAFLFLETVTPAHAFDFSSIDPRLSSDRDENAVVEPQPQTSSVFRSPQNLTRSVEQPKTPAAKPMRNSSVRIVAVVNGDIISTEDIDNRVKAFIMINQIPVNDENKAVIYQRVLTSTIDEKLKVQDAEKNGINITEKEVDNAIAGFEQTNKIPTGKINSILKQYGISEEAFREQMKSDLAWMRLVRQKAFAGGGITDKDVQKELAVAKADFASPKYQMSEIFISSKNAARASQLAATLKNDPRFEYYAFQFSESPTASNGGKLGWINKESLAQPLQKALEKLKPGQISAPIQVENGYYILRLEQIYTPGSNTHMPTEADIRQFLENQKLDTFATQYIQTLRQKAVVEFRG